MKFEIDKRTGLMHPVVKPHLEFQNLAGGLKVIDNKLHTSFVILRTNDKIGYAQGIVAVKGTNVFDRITAKNIADKVYNFLPNSRYTDYRMFLIGYKPQELLDQEDDQILEYIINSYDKKTLNEGLGIGVDDIQYSDKRTVGVNMKGLKGAAQALPSAIVQFLICPPMAMISLLGAVHHRLTERYLKSKSNSKVWLDYIAMSKPSDLKEKAKKAQQKKIQYYYSSLANGEILKVPAVNTIEAKDMILAISRKDVEPRYANYNNGYYHMDNSGTLNRGIIDTDTNYFESNLCDGDGNKVKMWCVKFNDGQACYAFGNDGQRDAIMEKAIESRKAVIDYYKSVVLKGEKPSKNKKGTDNWKDTKMKHGGIGNDGPEEEYESLFTVPSVDDMIEITNSNMYFPIIRENDRDFSTPQTGPMSWQPRKNPSYRIIIGEANHNPDIIFNIPATNENEVSALLNNLTLSNDFKSIILQQQMIQSIIKECCLKSYTGLNIGYKRLSDLYHTPSSSPSREFIIDQVSYNICGHIFNLMVFKPSVSGGRSEEEIIKKISDAINQIGSPESRNLVNYIISKKQSIINVQKIIKSVMTSALYNKASKSTKAEMYRQMNNMSVVSASNAVVDILTGVDNMNKFSTWKNAADIFSNKTLTDINNCAIVNPDTDDIMTNDVTIHMNNK